MIVWRKHNPFDPASERPGPSPVPVYLFLALTVCLLIAEGIFFYVVLR